MPDRYKREIEKILEQAGETPVLRQDREEQTPSFGRLLLLYLRRSAGGMTRSLRPGRLMFIGVSLLVLALIFSRLVPGVGAGLALAGLLLFVVAYAMFFVKSPRVEKRWRGQPLDVTSSWWDRFRKKRR